MRKYFPLFLIIVVIIFSCKKDSPTNSWNVKYEITCTNPNIKVIVVYRDQTGGVAEAGSIDNYQQLPWSYNNTWSKDPGLMQARSLSLAVGDVEPYIGTDVMTAKIYVNGKVINQQTYTSGGVFPFLTYVLQ
ncbi:hypothetical protein FC093_19485 [Ilyomonas limi]|uniref:Uncharacterized protein n=1 Tax=Ilyomonas limi TaxID=2575867 RepID=A0A4U3KTH6_9BACT|nr:hypothetical protein [Ilyomonas limi]TKK65718.1 hypothetical protein FC093_19485 [Ilyomonas limi]